MSHPTNASTSSDAMQTEDGRSKGDARRVGPRRYGGGARRAGPRASSPADSRQRVALAGPLVTIPGLFLLDEPLAKSLIGQLREQLSGAELGREELAAGATGRDGVVVTPESGRGAGVGRTRVGRF